jgi:hypothetical protein
VISTRPPIPPSKYELMTEDLASTISNISEYLDQLSVTIQVNPQCYGLIEYVQKMQMEIILCDERCHAIDGGKA